ncbi:MAG: hypothetical protein HYZ75_14860 [Elusimicrobia bacterium]|nr:hypothetical protein [Elusimicrobiota bacterium]
MPRSAPELKRTLEKLRGDLDAARAKRLESPSPVLVDRAGSLILRAAAFAEAGAAACLAAAAGTALAGKPAAGLLLAVAAVGVAMFSMRKGRLYFLGQVRELETRVAALERRVASTLAPDAPEMGRDLREDVNRLTQVIDTLHAALAADSKPEGGQ